jgi:uncharacterized protein YuzE
MVRIKLNNNTRIIGIEIPQNSIKILIEKLTKLTF